MTSLYQLEILWIWQGQGIQTFELPFYILKMSLSSGRDLMYSINAIAFALGIVSALELGKRRKP